MRLFKFLIVIGLFVGLLLNYRLLDFENGFAQIATQTDNASSNISTLLNIEKITYYENPIQFASTGEDSELSNPYIMLVATDGITYIYFVSNEEVSALSVAGIFLNNISPDKISPIPFYYFLIVLVVILFLPTKKHA